MDSSDIKSLIDLLEEYIVSNNNGHEGAYIRRLCNLLTKEER